MVCIVAVWYQAEVCTLIAIMWINIYLIYTWLSFVESYSVLSTRVVSAAVSLKTWILLPPSVLVFGEEAGLFKSRKDVCEGAGSLSLLFVKPLAGMWICQDDRQPPTYLSAPPCEHYNPSPPISARPLPPAPAAGRDLGIPAVTQELPPLLSAFFSSRSEPRTSLGPDPGGPGWSAIWVLLFPWNRNLKYLFHAGNIILCLNRI